MSTISNPITHFDYEDFSPNCVRGDSFSCWFPREVVKPAHASVCSLDLPSLSLRSRMTG